MVAAALVVVELLPAATGALDLKATGSAAFLELESHETGWRDLSALRLSRCDKCPRVFPPTGLRLVSRNLTILFAIDLPILEITTTVP